MEEKEQRGSKESGQSRVCASDDMNVICDPTQKEATQGCYILNHSLHVE